VHGNQDFTDSGIGVVAADAATEAVTVLLRKVLRPANSECCTVFMQLQGKLTASRTIHKFWMIKAENIRPTSYELNKGDNRSC